MSFLIIDYNDVSEAYDYLIEHEYFTSEELNLITSINGYTVDTLNDCLYSRYGYRDLEQMLEE